MLMLLDDSEKLLSDLLGFFKFSKQRAQTPVEINKISIIQTESKTSSLDSCQQLLSDLLGFFEFLNGINRCLM